MIIEIIYRCEHCNQGFSNARECVQHEDKYHRNPAVKPCVTCKKCEYDVNERWFVCRRRHNKIITESMLNTPGKKCWTPKGE
jgi:hypothetical protein